MPVIALHNILINMEPT